MFVFYFAVLSEATPPTALAAVAAAAVTGGRVIPTMWQTLRYTLPAFLVPIAFVLSPAGEGLLGHRRPDSGRVRAAGLRARRRRALRRGRRLAPRRRPGRPPGTGRSPRVAALVLLWLEPVATAVGAAAHGRRRRAPVLFRTHSLSPHPDQPEES